MTRYPAEQANDGVESEGPRGLPGKEISLPRKAGEVCGARIIKYVIASAWATANDVNDSISVVHETESGAARRYKYGGECARSVPA